MNEKIDRYPDNLQLRLIAEKIRKICNPQKIILFGSRAYGRPTQSSDIDLLIIMETGLKFYQQAARIRLRLDDEIGARVPMDILVRTPAFVDERLKAGDVFLRTGVEKYFKAILQEKGVLFEKIHDLDVLLEQCKEFLPELSNHKTDLVELSSFAVEVRYPGVTATEEEAKGALSTGNGTRRVLS